MTKRMLAFVFLTALAISAVPALAGGHHRGHHHRGHHHGHVHSGVSIGVGIGGYWPGGYGASPVRRPAPVWMDRPAYAESTRDQPVDAPRPAPDPVFVPGRGQGAAQTEADRRACNRATMTQADAMHDAQVFHRRTLACMASRGYRVE